jgi:hypothetical protein
MYQHLSRVKNQREAETIERAFRTQLANGDVGIEGQTPVPRLRDFAQQSVDVAQTRHANKLETVKFYANRLKRLLEWEKLRETRLDRIDEALIARYTLLDSKNQIKSIINYCITNAILLISFLRVENRGLSCHKRSWLYLLPKALNAYFLKVARRRGVWSVTMPAAANMWSARGTFVLNGGMGKKSTSQHFSLAKSAMLCLAGRPRKTLSTKKTDS